MYGWWVMVFYITYFWKDISSIYKKTRRNDCTSVCRVSIYKVMARMYNKPILYMWYGYMEELYQKAL